MAASGTIFDNPWFTFERPAFDWLRARSDAWLTFALIIGALVIVAIALNPRTPTIAKAVVLAYITLP